MKRYAFPQPPTSGASTTPSASAQEFSWAFAVTAIAVLAVLSLSVPQQSLAAQQSLQAQVTVVPLQSPYLSDFDRSPQAMMITVSNPSRQDVRFKVSGTLRLLRQNRIVVRTIDDQTREFVVPASGNLTLLATDFLNRSTLDIAQQDQEAVLRTNRIPEGEYELCVKLIDPNNRQRELSMPIPCRQFRTQTPQAPQLLSPINGKPATQAFPVFSWTPTFFTSGRTALYIVTVARILPGQTPRQALESNIPLVKSEPLQTPSFSYPPTAEQLSQIPDATQFVWQVQALDENGVPIGENNGKSEIWTFSAPREGEGAGAAAAAQSSQQSQPTTTPTANTSQETFPAAGVSGTVQLRFANRTVPAAGLKVSMVNFLTTVAATTSDMSGRFQMSNITTFDGDYSIRVAGRGIDTAFTGYQLRVGDNKTNITLLITPPQYQATFTVKDQTEKGLQGASVKLYRPSEEFAFAGEGNATSSEMIGNAKVLFAATTDNAGIARFDDLIRSSNVQDYYVAVITARGFKPQRVHVRHESGSILSKNVVLEPAGLRVTGIVREASTGAPAANASVNVLAALPELAGRTITVFKSVSDDDGTFTVHAPPQVNVNAPNMTLLFNLSAGTYTLNGQTKPLAGLLSVAAAKSGIQSEAQPLRPNDAGEADLTLSLPAARVFTGLVTNKAGIPLQGVTVSNAETGLSVRTDGTGTFRVESGAAPFLKLTMVGYMPKELRLDAATTGVPPTIVLDVRRDEVDVQALDARTGKPIAGASVVLVDSAAQGTTAASGIARLTNVPLYARSVTVYAKGYAAETVDFLMGSGDKPATVTVRLYAGGTVRGTVNADGKPLAGAVVTVSGFEETLRATSGSDGSFMIESVPLGAVSVIARAQQYVSARADVNIAGGQTTGQTTGQTAQTTLTLKRLDAGITQLAGFNVRVDAARENGANLVISGVITDLKSHHNFASLVNQLTFSDVAVNKATISNGNALPVGGKFSLAERELPMKLLNEFPAKARPNDGASGIEVVLPSGGATQGVVSGQMFWQFGEYVSAMPGARTTTEELGVVVEHPVFGKGDDATESVVIGLFTPALPSAPASAEVASLPMQQTESEYRTRCTNTGGATITLAGGHTLALNCSTLKFDATSKTATFTAQLNVAQNPFGLTSIPNLQARMGSGFQLQAADATIDVKTRLNTVQGWELVWNKLRLSLSSVTFGGSLTFRLPQSETDSKTDFTSVGVASTGFVGGSFSKPASLDLAGIATLTTPDITAVKYNATTGLLEVSTQGGDANFNKGGVQWKFTFTGMSFNSDKNQPVTMGKNLPKTQSMLRNIVMVELRSITFETTPEFKFVLDGGVGFKFPMLEAQVGNFGFTKTKFLCGDFAFSMNFGIVEAGLGLKYKDSANKQRFEGTGAIGINKKPKSTSAGNSAVSMGQLQGLIGGIAKNSVDKPDPEKLFGVEVTVGYESATTWNVEVKANIPPVPIFPPYVFLSGVGGGYGTETKFNGAGQSQTEWTMSILGQLTFGPSAGGEKPGTADIKVTVGSNGKIEGDADAKIWKKTVGKGNLKIDVPNSEALGMIGLNFPKQNVGMPSFTGSVNYGIQGKTNGYYFGAKVDASLPGLGLRGKFAYAYDYVPRDTVRKTFYKIPEAKLTNATPAQKALFNQIMNLIPQMDEAGKTVLAPLSPYINVEPLGKNFLSSFVLPVVDRLAKTSGKTTPSSTAEQNIRAAMAELTEKDVIGVSPDGKFTAKPPFLSVIGVHSNMMKAFYMGERALGADVKAAQGLGFSSLTPLRPVLAKKYGENKLQVAGENSLVNLASVVTKNFLELGVTSNDVSAETKDSIITRPKLNGLEFDMDCAFINFNEGFDIGILKTNVYAQGGGRIYFRTEDKDFKTGSGGLELYAKAGFYLWVLGMYGQADAAVSAGLNIAYTPNSFIFGGDLKAALGARFGYDICCAKCSAGDNGFDMDFICLDAKAAMNASIGFSYNSANGKVSFNNNTPR
jgi:hypothetical protein